MRFEKLLAHPGRRWCASAAHFYLRAIQRSDYEALVGGALRDLLGPVDSLLDVGAGGGQPGAALLAPDARWTAVEPNALLARHLARRPERPRVLRCRWQAMPPAVSRQRHDVVLAANMPGPLGNPVAFLRALRPVAREAIAWVVPAQAGPRRNCLAGFVPADLHSEREEPAVHGVLRALEGAGLGPDSVQHVSWNFQARFATRDSAQQHLEQHFNPTGCRRRRHRIHARLARLPRETGGGVTLTVPKQSACLVWRH